MSFHWYLGFAILLVSRFDPGAMSSSSSGSGDPATLPHVNRCFWLGVWEQNDIE